MISTQRDLFYWENSRQRKCTFESQDADGTPRLSWSSADEEEVCASGLTVVNNEHTRTNQK
jgi:hypothetical protein